MFNYTVHRNVSYSINDLIILKTHEIGLFNTTKKSQIKTDGNKLPEKHKLNYILDTLFVFTTKCYFR